MKILLGFLAAFLTTSVWPVSALAQTPPADTGIIAAVTAADEERLAATKGGDRVRLEAIFSDELRYAHSSGKIDTKKSLIESLAAHATSYESFDYKERTFSPVSPGVVLMTGRVLVHVQSNGKKSELDLNFLAVWREENGHWRFRAWQSCKNPPSGSTK